MTYSPESKPINSLKQATARLLSYCRDNDWAGYDPYDGLNSAVFAAIPGSNHRWPRLAFTQFMKRCPVNFRPICSVPKEQNPKGIALFSLALIKLVRLGLAEPSEVKRLISRLLELRSQGWSQHCWGYNFDWQTRTYLVPRGTPNIICTTFAGHALVDAYEAIGDGAYLKAAVGAGHFLLEGLHRTESPAGSCFSYTPLDRSQIHNANLLGAAFLARLYCYHPSQTFADQILSSVRFSLARQREDGSWPYGESARQQWIDSFHTGYNLVALKGIQPVISQIDIESNIRKGLEFFQRNFLTAEGIVKYYHDRTHPIDIHALAHAIVTLVEFKDWHGHNMASAWRICEWTLRHMRSDAGYFYFQKWPIGTNRIPYIRWSQAWMLLATATLMEASQTNARQSRGIGNRTLLHTNSSDI